MDTSTKEKEAPDNAASTSAKASSSSRTSQLQKPRRRLLTALITIAGLGLGIYFLAIYPRLQNSRELATLAAAAQEKSVMVVKPTQTDATAPLILPGNIEA